MSADTQATLIVTRGLPGSGKTTWAKALGVTRVNRDALRDMLHDVRDQSEAHEAEVTVAQHAAVRALLAAGVDVVADDTSLRRSDFDAWVALAAECGARLEVADQFLAVPVDVCVARQAGRPVRDRVPEWVIRDMAVRYRDLLTAACVVCERVRPLVEGRLERHDSGPGVRCAGGGELPLGQSEVVEL